MNSFNDREKAHENKFALDEEVKFRVNSRRRKLLGLWVGEQIGLSDEESLKYALEIVGFGIENNTKGAVIAKIIADAEKQGKKLDEATVRAKNSEFEVIATRQIMEEKK
jgi:hypothetical protein